MAVGMFIKMAGIMFQVGVNPIIKAKPKEIALCPRAINKSGMLYPSIKSFDFRGEAYNRKR